MKLLHLGAGALLALTSGIVNAQFPPKPEGLKVLESRFGDGVQISYKAVSHNPCATVLPQLHLNGKHGHLDVHDGCAMHINYWYMEAFFPASRREGPLDNWCLMEMPPER